METNKLPSVILILVMVGLLAGIGVLTLDKFQTATLTSTTITDESITIAGATGTTTYDNVTSVSSFGNASVTFTIDTEANWTSAGVITTLPEATVANGTYSITYTIDQSGSASGAIGAGRDAVADIPNDWMALIVTIVVLALILGMVMTSFRGRT